MKRTGRLLIVVVLLALFSVACTHYVCPAYSSDYHTEQAEVDRG